MPDFIEPLESRLLWSAHLSGAFAGHLPAALNPGRPNRVAIRVINTGDQPASGPVSVNLFASSDPALGGEDALITSTSRTIRLKPGRGATVPLHFNSPAGLQDGNYFLVAQVGGDNADGTVASPQAVAIQHPFVDLVGQFSDFPIGPVDVNNTANDVLGARVINQGNVPAVGPLAVSFYASTDATPDPSDVLIGVAARNVRIRPGGSQFFVAPIQFPSGTTVGNYYVFAQVDSAQAFAESDEGNNTVVAPRQLIAANIPVPTVIDQRDQGHHHHHHEDQVVVVDGGVGGAIFVGEVVDEGDFSPDPFMPDNSPPADSGSTDQPPADSAPPDSAPPDSAPPDNSGGWDPGSSSGSDF